MIVLIQCAAAKKSQAGHFRRRDGREILFVAKPEEAPRHTSLIYARPDDISDTGARWRDELLQYNESPADNPFGLLPAYQLYKNATFEQLAHRYGIDCLYILSAGWGLIKAEFLTPKYDITFRAQADSYKRRRRKDIYDDYRMLPANTEVPVVFFVGKDYVPLATQLTVDVRGPRYLFYNSKYAPNAPGCILKRYETRTRTNWHYECARAFMDGKLNL